MKKLLTITALAAVIFGGNFAFAGPVPLTKYVGDQAYLPMSSWASFFSLKTTPNSGDRLIIQDIAASWGMKYITVGSLPTGGTLNGANSWTGNNTFSNTSSVFGGNAATATKLNTPRNINGVAFDGTANITVLPNVTNDAQVKRTEMGSASGVATLDSSSQLRQNVPWANLLSVPSIVNTFNSRSGAVTPQSGDYTASQVGLGNVTNDAQLKRAAGDFASYGNKASPNSSDLLLIEDSAASGVKKNIAIGNLPNAPLTPSTTSSFSFIPTALPTTAAWVSIAWNGTVFCAIAGGGTSTNVAATSPDGRTWTAQTLPSSTYWTSIAWNGTVFCALGCGSGTPSTVAATSPDGHTWTAQTLPASAIWESIAWNGTVFCAVAYGGTTAATSPDGHTWTAQTLPASTYWTSITANGTLFCAINNITTAATSPDGHTWTLQTLPAPADGWRGLKSNGSIFCALGYMSNVAITSPDAHTWTSRSLPANELWDSLAWNGTVFCAIAYGSNVAATSPDGTTWTTTTLPSSSYANAIGSNGNSFCVIWSNTNASSISTGQLLKNNNAGGFTGATPGLDYQLPQMGGILIGTQYLTSGSTYTPDPGTNAIDIRAVAGGGGGGYNKGGSGGAGGYLEKRITSFSGTASYVIGAAGTAGVSGVQPVSGGNTTFTYNGVTYTAYGGGAGTNASAGAGGTGGAASVNGDFNEGGGDGYAGLTANPAAPGGGSFFGGGSSNGNNSTVYGAGGSGGPGAGNGGTGGQGAIIVEEYN